MENNRNVYGGGKAYLVLLRDVKSAAAGAYVHVLVDGMPAALIRPGVKIQLLIEPGIHTINAVALEASSTGPSEWVTLLMEEDTIHRFRIYFNAQSNRLVVELAT